MAKKATPKRIHKRKRNKKKNNFLKTLKSPKILGNICFLLLFLGCFYLFYFSPFFQIKEVKINTQSIQIDDFKKTLEESLKLDINFFGKNISTESLFLPFKPVIDNLESSFPQIENINLKREIPNILTIEVQIREPYAYWCEDIGQKKDCSFVDNKGVFFQSKDFDQTDLIKIEGNKKKPVETIKAIQAIINKLDKKIEVEKFIVFDDKLSLKIPFGPQVFFDINKNLNWQVEKLHLLLKEKLTIEDLKKLEYIDLRFGDQAIIK